MDIFAQNHSIEEIIRHHAFTDPSFTVLVSSKYNSLSYSQLIWQIDHVGYTLHKTGFGRSARIAIAVKEAASAALAIVSVACYATAVPLDQNLAAAEIELRLTLLNVDAICVLANENTPTRVVAAKHGMPVIELTRKDNSDLLFLMSVPHIPNKIKIGNDQSNDVAIIFQTSGTTAEPKLVPCHHGALLAAAKNAASWFNLDKKDRCLSVAPPYYSHGLTFTILAPLLSGGSVAFPLNLTDVNIFEWLETLSPTWYSTSPTIHLAIAEKLATASGVKHHLRLIGSGGAPLPESVRLNLKQALGIPVLEHYGMTEASQISTNLQSPGLCKAGTVGIPPSGTVMIAGRDGNKVSPGDKGEILVCGPNVIRGYLNGQELNETAFSDGWFHTGDIGSLDEEGFLTLHGRINELINRGGEKISPVEVETVILKHPAVTEAVAFAVPHQRLGEDVGLAVVLRPGANLPPDEFRRFMSAQVSWNKIPRRVHFMESIPKGLGGKALRRKLRDLYE
ncbi:MAG: AMP-binding protein [Smithella sp.]|nr:AMP-binding protein [Smithella sp.]